MGASTLSCEKWEMGPVWLDTVRDLDLEGHGSKRMKCYDKDRAKRLVHVAPADNLEFMPGAGIELISAPYYPEWLKENHDEIEQAIFDTEDDFGENEFE
jgi:hypothetical protein